MKRLLATALTALMLMSLCCTPAIAAPPPAADDPSGFGQSAEVKITVDMDVNHKYSIDITYPTMVFTYNSTKEWVPGEYSYQETHADAGWSDPQTVTITNHSDMPIKYTVTASVFHATYKDDLDIDITNGEAEIGACTIYTTPGDMKEAFTVGVSGTPGQGSNDQTVTLGSLNIAFNKP